MPKLHIEFSDSESLSYEIPTDKEVVKLGRISTNDVVLLHPRVSRRHFEIHKVQEGYMLQDLGSSNGTFLNGERVNQQLLKHKDRIQIASIWLSFIHSSEEMDVVFPNVSHAKSMKALMSLQPFSDQDNANILLTPTQSNFNESEIAPILERNNKILYILYRLSQKLPQMSQFDDLLDAVLDLILEVVTADFGFIATLDEYKNDLTPQVIKSQKGNPDSTDATQISPDLFKRVIRGRSSVLLGTPKVGPKNGTPPGVSNAETAIVTPLWYQQRVVGLIKLHRFGTTSPFTKKELTLVHSLSQHVGVEVDPTQFSETLHLKESLKQASAQIQQQDQHLEALASKLSKFLAPQVYDLIFSKDNITPLKTQRRRLILFCSEVVDFGDQVQSKEPEVLTNWFNSYLNEMMHLLLHHGGTLATVVGDSLLVFFGSAADSNTQNDAIDCVNMAIEMRSRAHSLGVKIRSGISTGMCALGQFGSKTRMDYMPLGEPVQLASQLKDSAAPGQILISDSTFQYVKSKIPCHSIPHLSYRSAIPSGPVHSVEWNEA